jgi:hypothetical protein
MMSKNTIIVHVYLKNFWLNLLIFVPSLIKPLVAHRQEDQFGYILV